MSISLLLFRYNSMHDLLCVWIESVRIKYFGILIIFRHVIHNGREHLHRKKIKVAVPIKMFWLLVKLYKLSML